MDKYNELLKVCEKWASRLDIPYFTMINEIYEPYKYDRMSYLNNDFIQNLYLQSIWNDEYKSAILELIDVDNHISKWLVPIFDDSCLKGKPADYKAIYDSVSVNVVEKVYTLTNNKDRADFYLITHGLGEGSGLYYGHKINLCFTDRGFNEPYYKMNDIWLTNGLDSIREVNTFLANDYIQNFFESMNIPQTKFNLGEEFFIAQLINDFKEIINDEQLEIDNLDLDMLLDCIKKDCYR